MATQHAAKTEMLFVTGVDQAWVEQVRQAMEPLLPKDFVGRSAGIIGNTEAHVELNIFMGSIANINIAQSVK